MKTVWKFPLKIRDDQSVRMPLCAEIIHAGLDPQGSPCVWALVEDTKPEIERTIHISGTGYPAPDGDNRHVGSFNHGPYVWHVWIPC